MLSLPSVLATPLDCDGKIGSKVMLDLTAYLTGPSEPELEYLLDLYETICPASLRTQYTIGELAGWTDVAGPPLTSSGQAAAAAGVKRPHFEPVRRRIRDGRAFEVGLWDGLSIDDSSGSWSFRCRRIHLRTTGLHACLRVLLPLQADKDVLRRTAIAIADNVAFDSGHGGLAFVYEPSIKEAALDGIYAQARRFWGVDVEDLNDTLPLMKEAIKGVSWITMLGRKFSSADKIQESLHAVAALSNVDVENRRHGNVIVVGREPAIGDQHRPDGSLDSYKIVANVLGSLFLVDHPDFPSERWVENGNTVGWIRRFLEPDGWR